MTKLIAVDYDAGKALFQVGTRGVVVDINKRDVDTVSSMKTAITAAGWLKVASDMKYPKVWSELAEAAATSLEVKETEDAPTQRKFRIPLSVKKEAQQAIDWVNGFERGDSTLGMLFAQQLATENYMTLTKISRLSKYFARRPESVKENSGWSPGEHGYPTDERIRYGLWGGDAAREWTARIAQKHSLTAATPVADGVDGNGPHVYIDDPDMPGQCAVCGRAADAIQHVQSDAPVIASAFVPEDDCDYFGAGVDPDSTEVNGMYMLRPDGTWLARENGDWVEMAEPAEDEIVILLDPVSAQTLAEWLDSPEREPEGLLELAMLNPTEAALFSAAHSEIDWEVVDRVFDIYDSTERSVNAKKQIRGPGGKFGETGAEARRAKGLPKARLSQPLPLVPDVKARITQYLEEIATQRGEAAPAAPETPQPSEQMSVDYINSLMDEYGGSNVLAGASPDQQNDVKPLYLAIVDSVDTEAVLDVVALMPPPAGSQAGPSVWKRDNGKWILAPDILAELQGVQPPPVVELADPAILQNVLEQTDEATSDGAEDPEAAPAAPGATPTDSQGAPTGTPKPDANPDQHPIAASARMISRGYALPDGSLLITDALSLRTAITASAEASNQEAARKHVVKRARALGRADLIPGDWGKTYVSEEYKLWGPNGEIISLVASEGGVDKNRGNAEKLRRYWVHGEGAAKIQWGAPGDWYRCVSHLSKYLGTRAKGYCTLRHHDALGVWPGQEGKKD